MATEFCDYWIIETASSEYREWLRIVDVFTINGPGVKTERDAVSIHWTSKSIEEAVTSFRSLPVDQIREKFGLGTDSRDWKVSNAKSDVTEHQAPELFRRILYRPFDYRHTWYSGKTRGFIGTPGYPVMKNMLNQQSLALIAMRQFEYDVPEYCYFFVTPTLTECRVFVSNRGIANVFPLYASGKEFGRLAFQESGNGFNFRTGFLQNLSAHLRLKLDQATRLPVGISGEAIFSYAYAIFHCRPSRVLCVDN